MILPDNTPASPTKTRSGPPSDVPEDEQLLPPPAYPGHSSSSTPVQQYQRNVDIEARAESSNAQTPLVQSRPAHHGEQVESAGKRFFKAFGIAILIYLVAASFTRTVIAGSKVNYDLLPLPKHADGKVEKCVSASSLSHRAPTASFNLPLSADVLYIFSRGILARGTIELQSIRDPGVPEDSVRVDIVPHSSTDAALSLANICLLERRPGEKGIGILTPTYRLPTDDVRFTIKVLLPIQKYGQLKVKAFETNLPLFSHTTSLSQGSVTFGSIHLSSENTGIYSNYLEADGAVLRTHNGNITGTYHAYSSLLMETSNDIVSAHVNLYHDDRRPIPTNLTIRTSNSPITASINLHSSNLYHTGGSFAVSTHTRNGRISTQFHHQAPDSVLTLDASTANAPAHVALHPAFEGSIALLTSHGSFELEVKEEARDPANRGRKRAWTLVERTASAVNGWVWWGKQEKGGYESRGRGKGSVTVRSDNAQVGVVA